MPPVSAELYHYRQMSAIGLAEIARQLGEPPENGIYLKARRDRYRWEVVGKETEGRLDLEDFMIF